MAGRHMAGVAPTGLPYRPGDARVVSGVRHLFRIVDLALDVQRERQMLRSMDEHALKDIGLSRSEAWAEACRSLWDVPRNRLRP
jgi:uncharacterized protein YjiS (DUF1127 family)